MSLYFPEFAGEFEKILDSVKGANIAVAGHMRPDGDCVGSQLALAEILSKRGAARVVCVNQNPIPQLYAGIAEGAEMLPAEDFADESFKIVTVDCAEYSRVSPALCGRFPSVLACIDHHATNAPSAKINIIDPQAAATAELVAGLALDAGVEISPYAANLLYMGVATDTRQFTTTSTRLKTFSIAAALVEAGADTARVAVELYQCERFAKLKLTAEYLKSLELLCGGKACIGVLPFGVFEKTGARKEDTDGLVDYARSVRGVEIAALLEDTGGAVKGSLRAKDPKYRVDTLAQMFGGGGHHAAAGFTAEGEKLETFYPKIAAAIESRIAEFGGQTKA
ncbi:MAG: DHH family phosphoesterase [Opitutales bacterium]|nr:DHH family phosphoesterase [Opitutales bacterium]